MTLSNDQQQPHCGSSFEKRLIVIEEGCQIGFHFGNQVVVKGLPGNKLAVVKSVAIIQKKLNMANEHVMAKVVDIVSSAMAMASNKEKTTFFSLSDKYNASETE